MSHYPDSSGKLPPHDPSVCQRCLPPLHCVAERIDAIKHSCFGGGRKDVLGMLLGSLWIDEHSSMMLQASTMDVREQPGPERGHAKETSILSRSLDRWHKCQEGHAAAGLLITPDGLGQSAGVRKE